MSLDFCLKAFQNIKSTSNSYGAHLSQKQESKAIGLNQASRIKGKEFLQSDLSSAATSSVQQLAALPIEEHAAFLFQHSADQHQHSEADGSTCCILQASLLHFKIFSQPNHHPSKDPFTLVYQWMWGKQQL